MVQVFLRRHRWSILAAGALIQIVTGVPAAWGVFQKGVEQGYGYQETQTSMVFSLTICFFGIGCVLGGYLQDKKGPRVAGIAGTILLAGGFVAAAFVPSENPWWLYGAFSVPVGLGSAALYPAVMSCAQKWYAERKGLATGIIGGAVGASGAFLTFTGRWLSQTWGIRTCFWVLGAIMALFCGIGCILLENPCKDDAATYSAKENDCGPSKKKDFSPMQMFKTKQYWLLLAVTALGTPAVLLFSPVIVALAQERGLDEGVAIYCIIIGSVFSAAGRVLMPWLSDKIGRRATDLCLYTALCAFSVAFIFVKGWWVIAVYSLLTFCYSGEAAVLPSMVTDLYGQKNTGINYGFVALGMSIGSIAFPLLARCFEGNAVRHIIAVAATVAGFVCLWLLKPTQGEKL